MNIKEWIYTIIGIVLILIVPIFLPNLINYNSFSYLEGGILYALLSFVIITFLVAINLNEDEDEDDSEKINTILGVGAICTTVVLLIFFLSFSMQFEPISIKVTEIEVNNKVVKLAEPKTIEIILSEKEMKEKGLKILIQNLQEIQEKAPSTKKED